MIGHPGPTARYVLAGTLLLGILAASAYAAVPTTMNYQGYLTGADGSPRNGTFAMAFAIYPDSVGGSALWSDAYASVPVSDGLFSLRLGAGTALPASVFSGATLWLETAVSDTVLAPRRSLVTVPFSFRAAVADSAARAPAGAADSLWTASGDDLYRLGGNVGLGTASPGGKLDVVGTVRLTGLTLPTGATSGYVLTSDASGVGAWAAPVGQGAIGGGGTPGSLAKFTAPNAVGNSVMWESGGRIGVGTPAPAALLHLQAGNPSSPVLIVQGAGGQAASLQEWRDYTGALRAYVNPSGIFAGDGSGLANLNASSLSSGAVPSSVLSGTYSNPVNLNNGSNYFTGDGSGLTNLNASRLSSGVVPSSALGGTYSNPCTFNNGSNTFAGDGSGLTSLNASRLSSGLVPSAVLGGTYSNPFNFNNGSNSFAGNGAGLSNLNASNLTSGAVPSWALGGTYSNPLALSSGSNYFAGSGAGLSNLNASALTSGTLASGRLPTGGSWTLSSGLDIGSGLLYVDRANGRIGIGTSSPSKLLTLAASLTDYDIITSGTGNLDITTAAGSNAGITISAQESSHAGITINNVNWVGIGTTPGTILTIQQNSASDPIADSWGTYSSGRWKENVAPIVGALELVQRLQGVRYDVKATGQHDIGMIAEDVGRVVPEVVAYEDNGVDAKSIDYARLTALLVEAVKQLKSDNEALGRRIVELEGGTSRP